MITSVAGAPDPVAVNLPVQPEIAPKAPVREQVVQASTSEPQPAEAKAAEANTKSAATPPEEVANESASHLPNINVRFRIDQKTNDVTVFLLDQQTQQVIRTIPPGELTKLTPGDLVNLFA
jgi:uncharacterized FlaG/YvyC family protein